MHADFPQNNERVFSARVLSISPKLTGKMVGLPRNLAGTQSLSMLIVRDVNAGSGGGKDRPSNFAQFRLRAQHSRAHKVKLCKSDLQSKPRNGS